VQPDWFQVLEVILELIRQEQGASFGQTIDACAICWCIAGGVANQVRNDWQDNGRRS
jgi:hypothetical protein